jgi:hypothetical protein
MGPPTIRVADLLDGLAEADTLGRNARGHQVHQGLVPLEQVGMGPRELGHVVLLQGDVGHGSCLDVGKVLGEGAQDGMRVLCGVCARGWVGAVARDERGVGERR